MIYDIISTTVKFKRETLFNKQKLYEFLAKPIGAHGLNMLLPGYNYDIL